MSEKPTQSIHNIIWRRTQLLAVILYYVDIYILYYLVYATREHPKMAQFDWFSISGYSAISGD